MYRLKDLKEEKLKPKGHSKFQNFFPCENNWKYVKYVKNCTKNAKLKQKNLKNLYLTLTGPKKPDVPKGCTTLILNNKGQQL